MRDWKLKTVLQHSNKHILFVVFAVFIFTQFISLHHQVQHLNDFNDIACSQCISTPDLLVAPSTTLLIPTHIDSSSYKLKLIERLPTPATGLYLAREPPSIVLV